MRMDAVAAGREPWKLLLVTLGAAGALLAGWAAFSQGVGVLIALVAGACFLMVVIHPPVGLYALLFLIPLQNLVVVGAGTTLLKVIGLSAGAAWGAAKVVRREPIRPLLICPLATPVLVFLAIAATSGSWSDLTTWRPDFVTYVQLAAMVFIVLDAVDSLQRLKRALLVLCLGCLISAGVIVYESLGPAAPTHWWFRPEGGHGDPNYTASTLLTLLPVVLWFMMGGGRWRWMAGGAGAALLLAAVGFTISRTGMLAIVLLAVAHLFLYDDGRMRLFLAIVLVLLAVAPLVPWDRISLRFSGPDRFEKLVSFRHAWRVLWRYPLTGGGLGGRGRRTVIYVIHNLFLEVGAQLGLPGLLCMVWLWVTAWLSLSRGLGRSRRLGDRHVTSLLCALRIGLLVYLLFSIVLSTHKTRMMWLVLALGAASHRVVETRYPTVMNGADLRGSPASPHSSQVVEAR